MGFQNFKGISRLFMEWPDQEWCIHGMARKSRKDTKLDSSRVKNADLDRLRIRVSSATVIYSADKKSVTEDAIGRTG